MIVIVPLLYCFAFSSQSQLPGGMVHSNHALIQRPVSKVWIFCLLPCGPLLVMPPDMLQSHLPVRKRRRTEPAATFRGRVPQPYMAPVRHQDDLLLKLVLLARARRGRATPGRMHTSHVLHKEILTVEVVRNARMPLLLGHVAVAQVTAPEALFDVLRVDVSLPLVLAAERRVTPVALEAADEHLGSAVGGR